MEGSRALSRKRLSFTASLPFGGSAPSAFPSRALHKRGQLRPENRPASAPWPCEACAPEPWPERAFSGSPDAWALGMSCVWACLDGDTEAGTLVSVLSQPFSVPSALLAFLRALVLILNRGSKIEQPFDSSRLTPRRARRRDAQRDTFSAPPARIFRERGFAETGMRDIADAADLSPRTSTTTSAARTRSSSTARTGRSTACWVPSRTARRPAPARGRPAARGAPGASEHDAGCGRRRQRAPAGRVAPACVARTASSESAIATSARCGG